MGRRWLGAGGMLQDVGPVTGRRSHPLCCLLPWGDSETPPPEQALLGQPAGTSASPPSPGPPLNAPTDDVSASTGAVSFAETGLQRVSAAWS